MPQNNINLFIVGGIGWQRTMVTSNRSAGLPDAKPSADFVYEEVGGVGLNTGLAALKVADHEKMNVSVTLCAPLGKRCAKNIYGNAVHNWKLDYHSIWKDSDQVKKPVGQQFIFVRNAKLLPDGGLLLSFSAWGTTPHGYGIARVDKASNVVSQASRVCTHAAQAWRIESS